MLQGNQKQLRLFTDPKSSLANEREVTPILELTVYRLGSRTLANVLALVHLIISLLVWTEIKSTVQCTVVNHSNRKGEINYFVPYEGLNWF